MAEELNFLISYETNRRSLDKIKKEVSRELKKIVVGLQPETTSGLARGASGS